MPATFESKDVSLNEAVTLIAFGEARTPGEEQALRIADQKHLVALIDRCCADAAGKAKYRRFPKQLPYFPISALIERLEDNRKRWPPSAVELHGYAQRLVGKWGAYLERYEPALHRILGWAAEGKIRAVGKTGAHPGAPVIEIERLYFLAKITISHTWRDIGPVTGQEHPQVGSILRAVSGSVPILYDVAVLRKDLAGLRPEAGGNAMPGTRADSKSARLDEGRRLVAERVEVSDKPMIKAAFKKALGEAFPNASGRELDRIWAEVVPPAWRKPGARGNRTA